MSGHTLRAGQNSYVSDIDSLPVQNDGEIIPPLHIFSIRVNAETRKTSTGEVLEEAYQEDEGAAPVIELGHSGVINTEAQLIVRRVRNAQRSHASNDKLCKTLIVGMQRGPDQVPLRGVKR